jgi:uncharacterized protein YbcV (DUF1398 family)
MDQNIIDTVQQCTSLSVGGKMTFPQVVGRLMEIGLERYHADYTRHEITYYLPNAESVVVAVSHQPEAIAPSFSAAGVEAAIRQIQRGEISYVQFVKQTMAAGCVGYFVQITGRRAMYFGRDGQTHVEHFPPAPAK